ncbi:hypothetical protein OAN22_00270 [Alphaproteobacteria bacterium]|nr:hypothetical protein [Alphaproteobacteria bacterium]
MKNKKPCQNSVKFWTMFAAFFLITLNALGAAEDGFDREKNPENQIGIPEKTMHSPDLSKVEISL